MATSTEFSENTSEFPSTVKDAIRIATNFADRLAQLQADSPNDVEIAKIIASQNEVAYKAMAKALTATNTKERGKYLEIAWNLVYGVGIESTLAIAMADHAQIALNHNISNIDCIHVAQSHFAEDGNKSASTIVERFEKSLRIIQMLLEYNKGGVMQLIRDRGVYSFWMLPIAEWKRQIDEIHSSSPSAVICLMWNDEVALVRQIHETVANLRKQGVNPIVLEAPKYFSHSRTIATRIVKDLYKLFASGKQVNSIILKGHGSNDKIQISPGQFVGGTEMKNIITSMFSRLNLDADIISVPLVLITCGGNYKDEYTNSPTIAESLKSVLRGSRVYATRARFISNVSLTYKHADDGVSLVGVRADQDSYEHYPRYRIDLILRELAFGIGSMLGLSRTAVPETQLNEE